jgi:NAD(P)H dehydrogenase (quinone)
LFLSWSAQVAAKIFANPSSFNRQSLVLTGDEAFSSAEICALAAKVWGRRVEYADVPEEAYKATLASYGLPEWHWSTLNGLEQFKRSGHAAIVSPTVEKVLGRKPTRLEDELKENKLE